METIKKEKNEISGIVKNYTANKHGDIDALELATDRETFKINFPPHTAKAVMEKAGQGSFIKATYQEETPKDDLKGEKKLKFKLHSISGLPGHDLVIKELKPQPTSGEPQVEKLIFSEYELLKGKKGELVGIQSGKQLIHIHKEDEALAGVIKPGATLEITAVKRPDEGFVNQHQAEVFHIQKVIIDGQEHFSKK